MQVTLKDVTLPVLQSPSAKEFVLDLFTSRANIEEKMKFLLLIYYMKTKPEFAGLIYQELRADLGAADERDLNEDCWIIRGILSGMAV